MKKPLWITFDSSVTLGFLCPRKTTLEVDGKTNFRIFCLVSLDSSWRRGWWKNFSHLSNEKSVKSMEVLGRKKPVLGYCAALLALCMRLACLLCASLLMRSCLNVKFPWFCHTYKWVFSEIPLYLLFLLCWNEVLKINVICDLCRLYDVLHMSKCLLAGLFINMPVLSA